MHTPALHVSGLPGLPVQTLPSEHGPLGSADQTQPLVGSQLSAVHALLSSHTTGIPLLHVPAAHWSLMVQALPSLHGVPVSGWYWQPSIGLQPKLCAHAPPSWQTAATPTQAPDSHVSPVVQTLPSLHGAALKGCKQPFRPLHRSSVHALPSLQPIGSGIAPHTPDWHVAAP